jgi:uncharacterized protein (TIGR03083 family)
MDFGTLLETLDGETRRSIDVVRDLPDAAFSAPTRCPPWDVRVLVGHMVRDLDRVLTYLADPAPETQVADSDLVAYWRSYDPQAEGPRITANSVETADRYATPADLVEGFDSTLRRCLEEAGSEDPARVLSTRLTSIRLDEFLKTRILEIGVHGLDLAAALGRPPWLTPAAASVVLTILVGLFGDDPAPALGWSDLTFIETGTGRRPLTEGERSVLGDRANAFPLLG